jgi:dTDP-4-amino-4,6-dideoxygalactose transaminase
LRRKKLLNSINDLDRLDKKIMAEVQKSVAGCISSGWYVLGQNVKAFEEEFARYNRAGHCVSVANGTQALEISLRACGVGPGDEVITVANAGFYSSLAILSCGAKPVYADINLADLLMDPVSAAACVSGKTSALIATHLFGRLADMEKITSLCRKKGLTLIEDCAQSHAAFRAGRFAGTFGDLGCFSFYPTKNLGAMGDGGAVIAATPDLARRVTQLRQYGWGEKYNVEMSNGVNSRLDEIQAAVLRVKLKYLDVWNKKRRQIAATYTSRINNPMVTGLPDATGDDYVAHLYIMRVKDRDSLTDHLKKTRIPYGIHYPVLDYAQKTICGGYAGVRLLNSEKALKEIITLPCFPEMTEEETTRVISAVNAWRR